MLSENSSKKALKNFFYPKSIAVIGASGDNTKIGGFVFSEILKCKNIKAVPINVKSQKIQGVHAFPSITEVDFKVDLAIIAIPSLFVLDTLEECAKKGIKNVVIITAGFKEVGEEGVKREEELKEIIHKYKLNVLGPNCLGFLNAEIGLNCSFAKDIPNKGNLALVSQSGAVIDAIVDWSFSQNIGFSKIVSCGNMAGMNSLDFLDYLSKDDNTSAICFYMETIENGEKFGELLKKVTKKKPVIIIKPGKSKNAQKAIGSHTGSLAQNNVLIERLIVENGGILAERFEDLYTIFVALNVNSKPKKNTVIVTNAGGPGVISTDMLDLSSFELYDFLESEKKKLRKNLPAEASVNNPVDVLGDAKSNRYISTLKTLDKMESVENILVLLTPQMMTDSLDIAKEVVNFSKKSKKTIYSSFLGGYEIRDALEWFEQHNFPNFRTPGEAIRAMNFIYEQSLVNLNDKAPQFDFNKNKISKTKNLIKETQGLLSYEETKKVLSCLEIELPDKKILRTKNDILTTRLDPKKRYVLKAENIVHKKDVGGVELGITSLNFEERAISMIETLKTELTLEEEVHGHEVIIGLQQNDLGKFVMFGQGGSYVNIFKDVHFSQGPLSYDKAKQLIKRSKVYELLKGVRGEKPINFESLVEILVRVSFIQEIFPEIKEVDLNPVMCNSESSYLVDVKLLK